MVEYQSVRSVEYNREKNMAIIFTSSDKFSLPLEIFYQHKEKWDDCNNINFLTQPLSQPNFQLKKKNDQHRF